MSSTPQFRSYLTQIFLNYFDDSDTRVREMPWTIDAQLLNSMAQSMEMSSMRINREIKGRYLTQCPLLLDNKGVYYSVKIPSSVVLPTDSAGNLLPLSSVIGIDAKGGRHTLSLYDDTLPVPSRITLDTTAMPVAMSNPVLFNITGNGNAQTISIQMPLPNVLTFWVEGMGSYIVAAATATIKGWMFPKSPWVGSTVEDSETVTLIDIGSVESTYIWQDIDTITVNGLPPGATLTCYALPFNMPGVADPDRNYTDPGYRDFLFPRYWQVQDNLIVESYLRNRFAGFDYIQSYLAPWAPIDLAVEPNTYGLWVTDGTSLYYMDRREPIPTNLLETSIMIEPFYGLDAHYDPDYPGNIRYAELTPVAYTNSDNLVKYRYLEQDPAGNTYVLQPEMGTLATFSGSAGWRRGSPVQFSVPLNQTGTYYFTLEQMDDQNNIVRDVVPYSNPAFNPLATINASPAAPVIKGIAFDAHQRLWIWTGEVAVPVAIHYDGYVFDPTTTTVYLTDAYSSVSIN
jgi:hypothetical protein